MTTLPGGLARKRTPFRADLLLGLLALLCLLPFSNKAFNIDDPFYIWIAQQIAKHPLDPFGFKLVWYNTLMPVSDMSNNPPLASYYAALIGLVAGWSERAMHIGFLLPALTVILGTYHLARRLTRSAWAASAATLLAPGFLVSSTSVMCDTMMLAFWVTAVLLWIKGLKPFRPAHLFASALLISACALTKFFGMAVIPMLFAYSLIRLRRSGGWIFFLAIPIVVLAGYQGWSRSLYGHGLLTDAAAYAGSIRGDGRSTFLTKATVGLSFLGGCALPGLTFAPFLWSRRQVFAGAVLSIFLGLICGKGAIRTPDASMLQIAQLVVFIAGGVSIIALAISDLRDRRDPGSLLLFFWTLGTFFFAGFVNWSINGRSVLPLIPAVGILLARRLDLNFPIPPTQFRKILIIPLLISGGLSLAAASADVELADSARTLSAFIHSHPPGGSKEILFSGHWGFQYYMQSYGAKPVDIKDFAFKSGAVLVFSENNSNAYTVSPAIRASNGVVQIGINPWIATMHRAVGAGFYSAGEGPLPFAFGTVAPERYQVIGLIWPPRADSSSAKAFMP